MPTKTVKKDKSSGLSNQEQLFAPTKGKVKVQSFAQFQPDNEHKRLDELIDQTIYIVKIEPIKSDQYGEGFKIWFKDLPNARDTYTAASFGAYVVPALQSMYSLSHDGKQITPDTPVKVTIRQAGRTYRLE